MVDVGRPKVIYTRNIYSISPFRRQGNKKERVFTMREKAIEKINTEMQKDPNDPYAEIIGHYIIDRCEDGAVAELVLKEGKTLKGAMEAVVALAKKERHGNVAVLTPGKVFGEVDRYFGMATDLAEQQRALESLGAPTPDRGKKQKPVLDLADFL